MKQHFWYTVDQGMGLRCDKCDAWIHYEQTFDYDEIKHSECPVSDEEFESRLKKYQ